jgi:PadR family transcriptional regulator PadR
VKLTRPLERLLRVLLADPSSPRYGYDLMKATGLASGTLYPMLSRLQTQGLVAAAWEAAPVEGASEASGGGLPAQATQTVDVVGRPPRKYYWLTGEGVRLARHELDRASQVASRGRLESAPEPTSAAR